MTSGRLTTGEEVMAGKLSLQLTTREARTVAATGRMRTVPKPPRDHRGTHLVGALVRPPETAFYLRFCSSGGGTRTHNLRINSPPLCQLSYPGSEYRESSSGLPRDRARLDPRIITGGIRMKLRSLILFGAGIMTGLAIARKMSEDEPEVMHGPRRVTAPANPALRAVTSQAQRMADRATVASLEAIKRARGAIRERLAEEPYDDVNWN
jgi:hypothetical protein